MIGDFSEALFIPPKFARNLDKIINNVIYLEDSAGKNWMVKFSKENCSSLAFKQGWAKFVLDHSISHGEMVIFRHVSKSTFSVHIFGTSCCERFNFPQKQKVSVKKKAKNIHRHGLEEENDSNSKRKRTEDEMNNDVACLRKAPKNIMNENQFYKAKKVTFVAISKMDDSDQNSFSYDDTSEEDRLETLSKKHDKILAKSKKAKACKTAMQGKIKCSVEKKEIRSNEHEKENVDEGVKGNKSFKVGFFDDDIFYIDEIGVVRNLHAKEDPIQMVYDQGANNQVRSNIDEAKSAPPGFTKIVSNKKHDTKAESPRDKIRERIQEMDAAKSTLCSKEVQTESSKQVVLYENKEQEAVEKLNPSIQETQVVMDLSAPLQYQTEFSITLSMMTRSWLLLPGKLPAQLVSKRKRFFRNTILLVDPSDTHWPVIYCENQSFTGFIGGWDDFVDANGVQQGDTFQIEATDSSDYVCPVFQVKFV